VRGRPVTIQSISPVRHTGHAKEEEQPRRLDSRTSPVLPKRASYTTFPAQCSVVVKYPPLEV
ncbi:MAG: hypothetical protein ACREQA_01030, partial [Candidatus Binatia bacterium]